MKKYLFIPCMAFLAAVMAFNACGGGGGGTTPIDGGVDYTVTSWTKLSGVAGVDTVAQGAAVDLSGNTYVAGYTGGNLDGETIVGARDLFVKKYDATGTASWTTLMGVATYWTVANSIAIDTGGNVYVSGYTAGHLTNGGASTGSRDVFIIKYNSSGTVQWKDQMGVAGTNSRGYGITTDSGNNVYITGWTNGALNGETLTGVVDMFVIKYNSSGIRQWTKLFGVALGETYSASIAVDSGGNIFVTGNTNRDLGGETRTGSPDVCIVKFDSSGTVLWTRLLGVAGLTTEGKGIALDSSGNCYVAGYTDGNLDGKIKAGARDMFVLKYNTSGTKQWSQLLGVATSYTQGFSIALDSSANCYVTGTTQGNLDGETLTGTTDAMVIKYDSSGAKQWTKLLGAAGKYTEAYTIAVDSTGYSRVVGITEDGAVLDGQTAVGSQDAFVTTIFGF